jgi:hypothetical protein
MQAAIRVGTDIRDLGFIHHHHEKLPPKSLSIFMQLRNRNLGRVTTAAKSFPIPHRRYHFKRSPYFLAVAAPGLAA